jgi:hypothetical protein
VGEWGGGCYGRQCRGVECEIGDGDRDNLAG